MLLQPVLSMDLNKSSSCTSLDSGKESACDDQLLRPDHLSDQSGEKLTLCLKESSPHSPDSGASGSSESPPTEAAVVSVASALSHPVHQHCQPASAAAVIAGLKRTHHSIDEALSTAQCIATAVLSAKECAPLCNNSNDVTSASSHVDQCNSAEGDESSSLGSVCDFRQKQTPDLVLDLPLRLNAEVLVNANDSDSASATFSVDLEEEPHLVSSPSGPESPDMTTAAERFAKQNQCTLKKNTKASHSLSSPVDSKPGSIPHSSPHHSKSVESHGEKDIMKPSDPPILDHCVTKPPSSCAVLPCASSQEPDSDKKPSVSSSKPPIKVKPQILKKPFVPPSQLLVPSVSTSKESSDLNAPDCGSTT